MKYINLSREEGVTPFDSIIRYGCGPNFVLNQLDTFESMIKEQGLTFWFRFWLTFCFDPGCNDLNMIEDKWADIMTSIKIEIHKEFLQGSVDDAIKFCLEKAIVCLQNNGRHDTLIQKDTIQKNTIKQLFSELLQECMEMAFGASLCEVFYKWLSAPSASENTENYWIIPNQYLNTGFQPDELETYLVEYWEDNLTTLLGVKLREVPWVLKLMYGYKDNPTESDDQEDNVNMDEYVYLTPYLRVMTQIADSLKESRNDRRLKISERDEVPKMGKIWSDGKLANEMEQVYLNTTGLMSVWFRKLYKQKKNCKSGGKDVVLKDEILAQINTTCRQCCKVLDLNKPDKSIRKCKRCVAEHWVDLRYYCNDHCQMEHWFQVHSKEHLCGIQKLSSEKNFTDKKDQFKETDMLPDEQLTIK